MKFAAIRAEKAFFPVALMCRMLEVSRSGYYAWNCRPPPPRVSDDERLAQEITRVHNSSHRRYGSPRVHQELRQRGHRHGRKRIARLMRSHGLQARAPRRFRRTTQADPALPVAPNLLGRNFAATGANRAWVSDITYLWTAEGWLYLVAILDLFSRRVVGWAIDERIDSELCIRALKDAIAQRRPAAGLVFHSDRGCQYASREFRKVLADHEIVQSMSRRGDCWDNAPAESFWSTLKTELMDQMPFATHEQARAVAAQYIENFYNYRRLHSRIGYRSPAQFELEAVSQSAAA